MWTSHELKHRNSAWHKEDSKKPENEEMNFLKSGSRRSNISRFWQDTRYPPGLLQGVDPRGPFSFPGQDLRHDREDLHKHQGAVEAAECEQCLRQAEEAHPHSPSR